jgi:multidrug efflux pump subunit AcrB
MQWLAELCVRRPVFASVSSSRWSSSARFAFGQLGVDRLPTVDFPTVTVTTRPARRRARAGGKRGHRQGRGSRQHHQRHRPAQLELAEGISQVVVTFRLEKNADVAAQEVRDRINRILPLLPRTITQPTIEKQDPDAQPVSRWR